MEGYLIEPWDHLLIDGSPRASLEQYVPPELEELARQVINHYDMKVSDMTLITSKPDKGGAIWKIITDKGQRSLKVLHRKTQRSLFSIGAQDYMVSRGAKVPPLIPTKENMLYVEAGGKLWIVTDWIDPLQPVSKVDLEGAASLCYGLGEFHRFSKGYVAPYGSSKSSRLFGWHRYYEKIITKLGWFRHIGEAYPETAASGRLLSVIDEFEGQALASFSRFKESAYRRMTAKGEPHWGLVHQDYGWSNGQMGPGGIWVIDLDGVAYDLPIRDLIKLITSTMDDMGTWDLAWIRGMIDAYHQANPIDRETFELLLIDMAFPNEFYKHVKEMVFDPVQFLNVELEPILQRLLSIESSKWKALSELENDKSKYLSGDYESEEDLSGIPYSGRDYVLRSVMPFESGLPETGASQESQGVKEEAAAARKSVPRRRRKIYRLRKKRGTIRRRRQKAYRLLKKKSAFKKTLRFRKGGSLRKGKRKTAFSYMKKKKMSKKGFYGRKQTASKKAMPVKSRNKINPLLKKSVTLVVRKHKRRGEKTA